VSARGRLISLPAPPRSPPYVSLFLTVTSPFPLWLHFLARASPFNIRQISFPKFFKPHCLFSRPFPRVFFYLRALYAPSDMQNVLISRCFFALPSRSFCSDFFYFYGKFMYQSNLFTSPLVPVASFDLSDFSVQTTSSNAIPLPDSSLPGLSSFMWRVVSGRFRLES